MRKIFIKGFLLLGCLAALTVSCRRGSMFYEDEIIARVGDEKLYLSEVKPIFKNDLTPQDSIKLLEQYVAVWVRRQLKIQHAERLFPEQAPDIERMVEDYRSSLLTHRLDQHYVDARIDTLLSGDEVQAYYDSHRPDFLLDRIIVRGVIVKLPYNHRQKAQIKDLMTKSGDKYTDFLELSRKNGFTVHEVATWMDFSEFLNLLPTNKLRNYDELADRQGVQEMRDGDDLYYVYIASLLQKGDQIPLEKVAESIRRIILNQRRLDIIRSYEDSIYNAALAAKQIDIKVDTSNREINE